MYGFKAPQLAWLCTQLCVQLQETDAHKLWLLGHRLLLNAHVVTHTVLHKLLPGVFLEPKFMQMLKGEVPYRAVMQSMYRDGMVLAGLTAAAVASSVHFVRNFSQL